jgi:hypothetical protein
METELGPAGAAVREPAEAQARRATRTYLATGAATFLITTLQLLLLSGQGLRPLLVPLMLVNFSVAALFYQGLWHEAPLYKATFGIGFFFGLVTLVGVAFMLQLGRGLGLTN